MATETSDKEKPCGRNHVSIEEAIHHARTNLGGSDVEPLWGAMSKITFRS
jgi:hypothetical protein